MGQGDDQVTLSAALTASGSLVDLGEGADTFTAGANNLTNASVKGFGGLDTYTFGAGTLTTSFINGNEAGDRITFTATTLTRSSIAGGSEDDIITFADNAGAGANTLTGGRVNGQNGNDTIAVNEIAAGTTTTMFGGQGNDTLTGAGFNTLGGIGTANVIFSGDLGNDTLVGLAQAVDISGDLLFGGDGNDNITSSNGADSITGGNGVDTITFNNDANTTAIFADVDGNGVISTGDTFILGVNRGSNFNNFVTNVTDFVSGGAGDLLNTTNGSNAVSGLGQAEAAGQSSFGTAGVTYKLAGSFNSANSTFTVTADNLGTDTLIYLNGAQATTAGNFVLLNGTSASTLVAANFI